MLSSGTCKELSAEWQRDRVRALKDSTAFTATELADLNVTTEGYGHNDDDNYEMPTQPVDEYTVVKNREIDIRKLLGMGD